MERVNMKALVREKSTLFATKVGNQYYGKFMKKKKCHICGEPIVNKHLCR